MKRTILTAIISLLLLAVPAQNYGQRPARPHHNQHSTAERGQHHDQNVYLNFYADHGETFIVYVDGRPCYPQPLHQVSSVAVEPGQHDICVRLVHPADRVATLSMQFIHRQNNFTVAYDSRSETLGLIPDQFNGHSRPTPPAPPPPPPPPTPPTPHTPHIPHIQQPDTPTHANETEMSSIVELMNKSPFDKDKLSLGKTFVKQHPVLSSQAVLMAKTITFEDSRLEFLIYAFDYCVDPENYFQTVEALTYSSSRDKLLEVINR